MNTPPAIAIDTETGGIYPAIHALLSIAAIREDRPDQPFIVYIWPEHGKLIEPDAAIKNGYTPEIWEKRGAMDLLQAVPLFHAWLTANTTRDTRIIAHNAGFDKSFLEEGFRGTAYDVPHGYAWRCSQNLLNDMMDDGIVDRGSASLDRLGELIGHWPKGQRPAVHEAQEDALVALKGYRFLKNLRNASQRAVDAMLRNLRLDDSTECTEVIRWKSADKELPDDDTTVLLQAKDGTVDVGHRDAGEWMEDGSSGLATEIVYWAELPEGLPIATERRAAA